jgi:imidazole glycerol phosphate synthase subunit HisF
MMSLSAVLAEIEASAEKIKGLEAALATEKENGKTLVQQYREQSADALKILGINEAPERKPRSPQAVLISAAKRSIRQTVKGGEKNAKAILAAALAAADKTAKTKLGLAEVPADIKAKIEERVKNLAKK